MPETVTVDATMAIAAGVLAATFSLAAAIISAVALHQARETKHELNSRMSEFLHDVRKLARAEGFTEGEQAERERKE